MELRWKRWNMNLFGENVSYFFKKYLSDFFLWNWWNWFARYQWLEKLTRCGIAFRVLNPLKTSCNVASQYDALFLSNFNHFQMEIIQWHFISLRQFVNRTCFARIKSSRISYKYFFFLIEFQMMSLHAPDQVIISAIYTLHQRYKIYFTGYVFK